MKQNRRAPAKLPPLCEPAIGDRVACVIEGHTAYGRVKEKYLDWFHVQMEAGGFTEKFSAHELWKVREHGN
jgi:hypothetical protein